MLNNEIDERVVIATMIQEMALQLRAVSLDPAEQRTIKFDLKDRANSKDELVSKILAHIKAPATLDNTHAVSLIVTRLLVSGKVSQWLYARATEDFRMAFDGE